MYTLKGKYNSANIMLPEGFFADEETTKQIYGFLNHPAFKGMYISLMPDLHAGAGSCIGFTATLNDYLIPNIVGVDIGCGVYSCKLEIPIQENQISTLYDWIKENIPSGFKVRNQEVKIHDTRFLTLLKDISNKIGSNHDRNLKSIGTLGGGNHFIELGIDSEGNQWLTVHSGSRKFGLDVCGYHQKRAKKHLENNFVTEIPKGLEFLYKDASYLNDMRVAQWFADTNRIIMLNDILKFIKLEFGYNSFTDVIESVHNYIGKDDIIRKGAVSAYEGEKLVIPFNMEDGLLIGVGKGSKKWNFSAPHGSGRIMSRNKAKETLSLEKATEEMFNAGIFTKHIPLDEVKDAYKPKELILEAIEETVEVIDFIKPIMNFKA